MRRLLFLLLAFAIGLAPAFAAAPAIPPGAPPSYGAGTLSLRQGPSIVCVGDSECTYGNVSNPAGSTYYPSITQVGTTASSYLGALQLVSGGAFSLDFVNMAYPGNYDGMLYVGFATQGSGCPASTTVTITISAPTQTPTNTAAALSFTTTTGGLTPAAGTRIYETAGANQGSGYVLAPTFTLSQTCSTLPTFFYALTGTGTFGVNGDLTSGWLARIPLDVCPAKPDWAWNIIGTNDLVNSVPVTTINANTLAGLAAEEACGIRPIIYGITPRGSSSPLTVTQEKTRLRVNAIRRQVASLTRAGATSYSYNGVTYAFPYPVVYSEADHYCQDPTSSLDYALATCVFDGLHQSTYMAMAGALAVWNEIKGLVSPAPIWFMPNAQYDVYDATNNPLGSLLGGTYGLFTGTTGTATTPCTTSSGLAASWNLTFGAGTGGATTNVSCVATLESSRTDGLPGSRQVVTISDASTNTSADSVTIALYANFNASLNAGDSVFLEGDVDLSNLSQVENIGCELREGNTITQSSAFLKGGNYGATYPMVSSATLAKWGEAKNLPDYGITASGSYRMHVRTNPIVVQSGDTSWTTQCVVYLNGASGTATATLKLGNFAVRKANAQ